jgi:hypothetical protein
MAFCPDCDFELRRCDDCGHMTCGSCEGSHYMDGDALCGDCVPAREVDGDRFGGVRAAVKVAVEAEVSA